MILRYTYTFMPKGILTRFIVETHPWIEQQKLVWKNGVVLNKDQTRAEIIENYNQREIKIRVAGNRTKELMAVITHELEKIHNSYERLQYQTLVPCNCETCKNLPTPYIMSAKLPIIKEPHPQPLPAGGEGRQSTALAGWGSSGLISNQADMILFLLSRETQQTLERSPLPN